MTQTSHPVISNVELARLQTAYPLIDIKPLTSQEEQLVLFRARGLSVLAASRAAGYTPEQGRELLDTPRMQAVVTYLYDCNHRQVTITTDLLNTMLLEAHRKAATSTEEVMAIRELGKLNDLYPSEKKRIEIDTTKIQNERQIESLSDDKLMELTGITIDLPAGDFHSVDEE